MIRNDVEEGDDVQLERDRDVGSSEVRRSEDSTRLLGDGRRVVEGVSMRKSEDLVSSVVEGRGHRSEDGRSEEVELLRGRLSDESSSLLDLGERELAWSCLDGEERMGDGTEDGVEHSRKLTGLSEVDSEERSVRLGSELRGEGSKSEVVLEGVGLSDDLDDVSELRSEGSLLLNGLPIPLHVSAPVVPRSDDLGVTLARRELDERRLVSLDLEIDVLASRSNGELEESGVLLGSVVGEHASLLVGSDGEDDGESRVLTKSSELERDVVDGRDFGGSDGLLILREKLNSKLDGVGSSSDGVEEGEAGSELGEGESEEGGSTRREETRRSVEVSTSNEVEESSDFRSIGLGVDRRVGGGSGLVLEVGVVEVLVGRALSEPRRSSSPDVHVGFSVGWSIRAIEEGHDLLDWSNDVDDGTGLPSVLEESLPCGWSFDDTSSETDDVTLPVLLHQEMKDSSLLDSEGWPSVLLDEGSEISSSELLAHEDVGVDEVPTERTSGDFSDPGLSGSSHTDEEDGSVGIVGGRVAGSGLGGVRSGG